MKLLLDENLPKRLKSHFAEHQIFTVRDMGWNGIKNGQLLELMMKDKFDVFLTFDKNLKYQQNFKKFVIPVLVLNATDNSYLTLAKLVPSIKKLLDKDLVTGPIEVKV